MTATQSPTITVRIPRELLARARREAVRRTTSTRELHSVSRVLADLVRSALDDIEQGEVRR
jgi:hypothetical protein